MMYGTYIGPIEHLRGQTALLRIATHGYVVAQFNDRSARKGTPEPFDFESPTIVEIPDDALGFGWHAFPEKHFQVTSHVDLDVSEFTSA